MASLRIHTTKQLWMGRDNQAEVGALRQDAPNPLQRSNIVLDVFQDIETEDGINSGIDERIKRFRPIEIDLQQVQSREHIVGLFRDACV
jgi:hypothetical protein